MLVSVAAGLTAAEAGLRLLPRLRYFFVLVPGTHVMIKPAGVLSGVSGISEYSVNLLGIRGRLFGPDSSEYRILAVGGSTTECASLDDTEAWTHLLEAELPRTPRGRSAWVGNVGRSGLTTRDNVLHLKYLLQQYPRIDVIIALVGVNDLQAALQQGWQYRLPGPITAPDQERAQLSRSFAGVPFDVAAPPDHWYQTTELWRLTRRVRLAFAVRREYDMSVVSSESWVDWRRTRQEAARWIDSLPPLDAPLREYRRNLNSMVDFAEAAGARLMFVTQPALWGDRLSDGEKRMLWFGWMGPDRRAPLGYYTAGALARAMSAYNQTVLSVCRDRGLACTDAASALSGDSTAMYDDVHFNELGARRLADELAVRFRRLVPFWRPMEAGPNSAGRHS